MKKHATKTQEQKIEPLANRTAKKQAGGGSARQLMDKRPGATAQRKLLDAMNNGAQVKQTAPVQAMADEQPAGLQPVQKKENNTGLPDQLKTGMEQISGYSMDDVKVHYHSDKPAQLQAHAYAQGTDIHIAPGQEQHLPHEAWHVVQQKQGRVKATMQMKGSVNVNDDRGLEQEADVMGAMALKSPVHKTAQLSQNSAALKTGRPGMAKDTGAVFQRKVIARIRTARIDKEAPRVISELRIEGRAPTTVPNAQGDHTVAETLINESVRREVMGQQPKIALNNLMVLAHLTLPKEGITELNENFFEKYWGSIADMEGEDQNTIIEEMIQRYIELANKREATAFLRDDELTRGNKGERKAIGGVRELADKLEKGGKVNTSDLALVAEHLAVLIDMRFNPDQIERYTMVIERAVRHAVLSVLPQLNMEQVQFMLARLMSVELGPRDDVSSENQNIILEKIITDLFK